jgi:general secretion pathway protein K
MQILPPAAIASGKDRGFVLLAVLLVSLILIATAAALTHSVRGRIALSAAVSRAAEAEALADAGFSIAMLDIEDSRRSPIGERRFPVGGVPVSCAAPNGAGTITIAVNDEAGKINLNSRNEPLLLAFLNGLDIEDGGAELLLARLLDYRDADDVTRGGAPEATFASLGPGASLKNRPFDVIEELAQVPGFPNAIFDRVRPYLTVYSDLDGFDVARAPPGLREIVSRGALRSGISEFSGSRSEEGIPRQFMARSTQRALTIVATATLPSGVRFTREAVVKISMSGDDAYVVRRWRQAPFAIDPPADTVVPPC